MSSYTTRKNSIASFKFEGDTGRYSAHLKRSRSVFLKPLHMRSLKDVPWKEEQAVQTEKLQQEPGAADSTAQCRGTEMCVPHNLML